MSQKNVDTARRSVADCNNESWIREVLGRFGMKISKLRMTAHVFRRLAQRGISLANVQVTLKYGRRIHRAHACFVFMAKKDVPLGQERQFDSIIGTTVVVEDDCIVTCYKNKRVLARLRRKPKKYHGYPSEQRITGYMTGTQRMAV